MARPTEPTELLPEKEPVQLLTPNGNLVPRDDYPVDLDDKALLALHEHMVVTRAIDQEFINLHRQGQLALYASCRGQEAAQVGSSAVLRQDDWIVPQYRELGAAVVRGLDPRSLGRLWRGTWHSDHEIYANRFFPICIPIATNLLHAAGIAMGITFDGEDSICMTYVGDGGTSEGDAHEAMNIAAVFDAPCVFFVTNNQYAISVPLSEQTHAPSLAHKGIAYGMPGFRVDGNDVLAVAAVTSRAIEHARSGAGSALVVGVTYRMEAHTTSDDPTRYRSNAELEHWAHLDPISRYESFLYREGLLDEHEAAEARRQASKATTELRDALFDAPDPDPAELFEHVFADPPPSLLQQAEQLRREQA